ncbi:hypothetical protein C8J57DRAFT_1251063 [Mycena rebaudengoi]|nr:hypothetical protein C8J57DRAFT_1251063 [Mycena rebaudengoi]
MTDVQGARYQSSDLSLVQRRWLVGRAAKQYIFESWEPKYQSVGGAIGRRERGGTCGGGETETETQIYGVRNWAHKSPGHPKNQSNVFPTSSVDTEIKAMRNGVPGACGKRSTAALIWRANIDTGPALQSNFHVGPHPWDLSEGTVERRHQWAEGRRRRQGGTKGIEQEAAELRTGRTHRRAVVAEGRATVVVAGGRLRVDVMAGRQGGIRPDTLVSAGTFGTFRVAGGQVRGTLAALAEGECAVAGAYAPCLGSGNGGAAVLGTEGGARHLPSRDSEKAEMGDHF